MQRDGRELEVRYECFSNKLELFQLSYCYLVQAAAERRYRVPDSLLPVNP